MMNSCASEHQTQMKAWHAAYRLAHKDKHKAYAAAWYIKNKEEHKAKNIAWCIANKDKLKAKKAAWDVANRDKIKAYRAIWRAKNRDTISNAMNKWAHRNPEKCATYNHNKRARRALAPGTHTTKEWLETISRWGGKCAYCGETTKLTRDHNIPLSRGGRNDIINIVPACRSCNSSKGTRTTQEFMIAEA